MTMKFREVKAAITTILGDAEAGRYRTIGYQRQGKSASEILGTKRFAQVYYAQGDFPKASGSINGPVVHEATYRVELSVAASGLMDLATLNDAGATPAQRATALANAKETVERADESLDELWDIVYQVLMDARNIDMGLSTGAIADRWLDGFKKDAPLAEGQFAVLTGSAILTMRMAEQIEGDAGVAPDPVEMETTLDIHGDDNERTGVLISNT